MKANLGLLFKETRKELDLGQNDLAKKLKISQSAVAQIENGSKSPSLKLLMKYFEILSFQDVFIDYMRSIKIKNIKPVFKKVRK